ncbi:hypothetical protein HK405_013725 [Cladochytrium tenue]|nr:hypothetical protein HK405_013725 [Cladochytrium tenue]
MAQLPRRVADAGTAAFQQHDEHQPAVTLDLLATTGPGITRSAYLHKLSTSESSGTFWKRRFLVFAGDTLYLFRAHDRPSGQPVGYMKLDRSSMAFASDHGVGVFNVRTLHEHIPPLPSPPPASPLHHHQSEHQRDPRDYRTWALQTDSNEAAALWINDIKAAIAAIRSARPLLPPPLASIPIPYSAPGGNAAAAGSPPYPRGRLQSVSSSANAAGAAAIAAATAADSATTPPPPVLDHPYVISQTKVAAYLASLSIADQPPPPEEFTQAVRERAAAAAAAAAISSSSPVPSTPVAATSSAIGGAPSLASMPASTTPTPFGAYSAVGTASSGGAGAQPLPALRIGDPASASWPATSPGAPPPPRPAPPSAPVRSISTPRVGYPAATGAGAGAATSAGEQRHLPVLTPYTSATFEIKNNYSTSGGGLLSAWRSRN